MTAYASLYERTRWTLRRFDVPVLAPGSAPLTVLHISDLHMTAGQRSKQEWVAGLAALEPDLVINTGDNLAGFDAVPGTLRRPGPADGPARARSCWPATTTTPRGRRTR